jgi:hypothetical protein
MIRIVSAAARALLPTAAVAVVLLTALAGGCAFHAARETGGNGSGGNGGQVTGGGAGSGGAITGLTSIRVAPPTAAVTVVNGAPAMQAFQAFGTLANGSEQDITSQVSWTVDRAALVTSVAGGLAKTSGLAGGVATISARNGSIGGSAKLTITFSAVNLADGAGNSPALPTQPAQPFSGPADTTRAPELVYPNDGVTLPPNLNGIEVHFRPGSTQNALFEIGFANAITDVRIYTRCVTLQDGCVYKPTAAVWRQIAETNRGLAGVNVSVRGTDDAGSGVGKSATIDVTFAKDDLRGGLYYWTTTLKSIERWDFGSTTQTAAETVVAPTDGDGSTCVGCHALSHDGKKLVATLGGQNDGRILLWDIAKKVALAKPFTQQRSQFESWNPDGTQFVGMYGDTTHTGPSNLILFDGSTALEVGQVDVGGLRADHPDWSTDGKRIVFTSVDVAGTYTDQKPQKSGLAYIDRTATGWSAPVTLLPHASGKNRYYPAIAPTNGFVVYNESTCASGDTGADCDADTDPRAMLWSVPLPASAAATPTLLAKANAPGVNDKGATALTNTYPKWSPFIFQLNEGHQVLWATFSSKRRYGLYPDQGMLYIWMVAVDLDLAGGSDPSSAAFCLPFQALDTSNHIAQWTTEAVPIVP